jgi:hypothetical protein
MPVVNLNDRVILTLTTQGVDAYKKNVDDNLPVYMRGGPYPSLNGDVLDTTLHELMNSLGAHFFNGAPQLVVDNNLAISRRSYSLLPSPAAGFYQVEWKRDEDLRERFIKALKNLNLIGSHSCFPGSVEIFYENEVCMMKDLRGCVYPYLDISDRILSLESFEDIAKRCNPPQEGQ